MTVEASALDRDLLAFSVHLFEQCGGMVEWPSLTEVGAVIVPTEVATAARLPGEEFSLSTGSFPGALPVNLMGDFMDTAARVLDTSVSRQGAFRIGTRYLTNRDLKDKIEKTFTWHNARAKYQPAEPRICHYHLWTFHATLRSEDVWEGLLSVAINAASGAVVDLPDVYSEPDLEGETSPLLAEQPDTFAVATAEAKRNILSAASQFIFRADQRLDRDRKRLQEYYRALAREDKAPKRRSTAPLPSEEELAARKKAVDLELRRKLAELSERYAFRAELRPITLARVSLPVLQVPAVIQRKTATRAYSIYWNSLMHRLEPLSCFLCHRATFAGTFSNDTVDLLCSNCAHDS